MSKNGNNYIVWNQENLRSTGVTIALGVLFRTPKHETLTIVCLIISPGEPITDILGYFHAKKMFFMGYGEFECKLPEKKVSNKCYE